MPRSGLKVAPVLKCTSRCPNLVALDVSETRVTGDGLTVFLHTHPNATHVGHEDTVLAFRRLPCARGAGDEKQQSALSKLTCSDCRQGCQLAKFHLQCNVAEP